MSFKGFSAPVRLWRPLRQRAVADRFEAGRGTNAPLQGREAELALLQRAWAKAREGQGHSVHIVGEAGIGKSRLVSELRRHITQGDGEERLIQCHHRLSNRPLHPFFNFLEALVGKEALSERNSATLGTELASQGIPVDAGSRPHPRGLRGGQVATRHRALADLRHFGRQIPRPGDRRRGRAPRGAGAGPGAAHRLRRCPLGRQHDRRADRAALRQRPGSPDPRARDPAERTRRRGGQRNGRARVATATTTITLAGLTGPAMADLVSFVWQGRAPAGLAEFIREKSDGVPLFGEELADFLQRRAGSGSTAADWRRLLNENGIATLNDLLSARLADAGAARRTAQVASVIGREFGIGVMERVLDPGPDAGGDRGRSRRARRPRDPRGAHRGRRDDLPLPPCPAAGGGLFQPAPGRLPAHPPAHRPPPRRWRAAQHAKRARGMALRPGWLPLRRSPLRRHRRRGLRHALGDGRGRPAPRHGRGAACARRARPAAAELRLDTLQLRGVVSAALSGEGSPETRRIYERAVSICRRLTGGDPADRFAISWGWWFTAPTITVQQARAWALIEDLEKVNDPEVRLQSYHCAWATNFHAGQHQFCLDCVAEGLALYDAERAQRNRAIYGGHDARVCGLGERALSLALMADEAGSEAAIADCLAWADAIGHVGSLVHALYYAVILRRCQGRPAEVLTLAERMRAEAEAHGMAACQARADMFGGWAEALMGSLEAGMRRFEAGLDLQQRIGTDETHVRSISTCSPRSSSAPGGRPSRSS